MSNIFYFHPYLEKISMFTNIFQLGWNHQLENFGSWKLVYVSDIEMNVCGYFKKMTSGLNRWAPDPVITGVKFTEF